MTLLCLCTKHTYELVCFYVYVCVRRGGEEGQHLVADSLRKGPDVEEVSNWT